MARETLEKWIRRQLTDPILNHENRRCTAIGLVHYKGGIRNEVQTIPLGGKEWDPKQLADMFNGVADEYAAGIAPDESGSGYEQFEAVSFFSDLPDHPAGTCALNRKTGPIRDMMSGSVASEAPDARGLTRQDMRHKEAWMQFSLDVISRASAMLLSHNESLAKRNALLERENYDAVELAKEMMFKEASNTHAHEMAEKEYERKTEERRKLLQLAPAAVNTLLGKEFFPQSVVDSGLLEVLTENLDEKGTQEVLTVLGKHLKPEAMMLLVDRMASIQETINARKHAKMLSEQKREAERSNGTQLPEKKNEPS